MPPLTSWGIILYGLLVIAFIVFRLSAKEDETKDGDNS